MKDVGIYSAEDIDHLLEIMARRRCLKIDMPHLKVELSPLAFVTPEQVAEVAQAVNSDKLPNPTGMPTEEELLFASSPLGPPETRTKGEEPVEP